MIKVFAFYPNLDNLPIRITTYNSKRAAYDYMSGLRMCDTPYVAFDNYDKVMDYSGGDIKMTKGQMALAIMNEAIRLESRKPYADNHRQQHNDT